MWIPSISQAAIKQKKRRNFNCSVDHALLWFHQWRWIRNLIIKYCVHVNKKVYTMCIWMIHMQYTQYINTCNIWIWTNLSPPFSRDFQTSPSAQECLPFIWWKLSYGCLLGIRAPSQGVRWELTPRGNWNKIETICFPCVKLTARIKKFWKLGRWKFPDLGKNSLCSGVKTCC